MYLCVPLQILLQTHTRHLIKYMLATTGPYNNDSYTISDQNCDSEFRCVRFHAHSIYHMLPFFHGPYITILVILYYNTGTCTGSCTDFITQKEKKNTRAFLHARVGMEVMKFTIRLLYGCSCNTSRLYGHLD